MQAIIRRTVDVMAPPGLIWFPLWLYIGSLTVFIVGMLCTLCIITHPIGRLTLWNPNGNFHKRDAFCEHSHQKFKFGASMALKGTFICCISEYDNCFIEPEISGLRENLWIQHKCWRNNIFSNPLSLILVYFSTFCAFYTQQEKIAFITSVKDGGDRASSR